jgi:hypothetical protein
VAGILDSIVKPKTAIGLQESRRPQKAAGALGIFALFVWVEPLVCVIAAILSSISSAGLSSVHSGEDGLYTVGVIYLLAPR